MISEERVVTTISIDDRKGKSNRMDEKVKSYRKKDWKIFEK
jgi:uncharacterized protein YqgV (UPF0045/DUF77 family)